MPSDLVSSTPTVSAGVFKSSAAGQPDSSASSDSGKSPGKLGFSPSSALKSSGLEPTSPGKSFGTNNYAGSFIQAGYSKNAVWDAPGSYRVGWHRQEYPPYDPPFSQENSRDSFSFITGGPGPFYGGKHPVTDPGHAHKESFQLVFRRLDRIEQGLDEARNISPKQFDLINEIVEKQMKTAIGRLATAFEQEMKKLEVQIDKVIHTQTGIMESNLNQIDKRLRAVENTVNLSKESRILDTLNVMDRKIELLEDIVQSESREEVKAVVQAQWRENISEWKEDVYSFLETGIRALKGEISDVDFKQKSFTEWFKDTITPEIAMLHNELERECKLRSESDEEILSVMAKYAKVMHRHFGNSVGGDRAQLELAAGIAARQAGELPPRSERLEKFRKESKEFEESNRTGTSNKFTAIQQSRHDTIDRNKNEVRVSTKNFANNTPEDFLATQKPPIGSSRKPETGRKESKDRKEPDIVAKESIGAKLNLTTLGTPVDEIRGRASVTKTARTGSHPNGPPSGRKSIDGGILKQAPVSKVDSGKGDSPKLQGMTLKDAPKTRLSVAAVPETRQSVVAKPGGMPGGPPPDSTPIGSPSVSPPEGKPSKIANQKSRSSVANANPKGRQSPAGDPKGRPSVAIGKKLMTLMSTVSNASAALERKIREGTHADSEGAHAEDGVLDANCDVTEGANYDDFLDQAQDDGDVEYAENLQAVPVKWTAYHAEHDAAGADPSPNEEGSFLFYGKQSEKKVTKTKSVITEAKQSDFPDKAFRKGVFKSIFDKRSVRYNYHADDVLSPTVEEALAVEVATKEEALTNLETDTSKLFSSWTVKATRELDLNITNLANSSMGGKKSKVNKKEDTVETVNDVAGAMKRNLSRGSQSPTSRNRERSHNQSSPSKGRLSVTPDLRSVKIPMRVVDHNMDNTRPNEDERTTGVRWNREEDHETADDTPFAQAAKAISQLKAMQEQTKQSKIAINVEAKDKSSVLPVNTNTALHTSTSVVSSPSKITKKTNADTDKKPAGILRKDRSPSPIGSKKTVRLSLDGPSRGEQSVFDLEQAMADPGVDSNPQFQFYPEKRNTPKYAKEYNLDEDVSLEKSKSSETSALETFEAFKEWNKKTVGRFPDKRFNFQLPVREGECPFREGKDENGDVWKTIPNTDTSEMISDNGKFSDNCMSSEDHAMMSGTGSQYDPLKTPAFLADQSNPENANLRLISKLTNASGASSTASRKASNKNGGQATRRMPSGSINRVNHDVTMTNGGGFSFATRNSKWGKTESKNQDVWESDEDLDVLGEKSKGKKAKNNNNSKLQPGGMSSTQTGMSSSQMDEVLDFKQRLEEVQINLEKESCGDSSSGSTCGLQKAPTSTKKETLSYEDPYANATSADASKGSNGSSGHIERLRPPDPKKDADDENNLLSLIESKVKSAAAYVEEQDQQSNCDHESNLSDFVGFPSCSGIHAINAAATSDDDIPYRPGIIAEREQAALGMKSRPFKKKSDGNNADNFKKSNSKTGSVRPSKSSAQKTETWTPLGGGFRQIHREGNHRADNDEMVSADDDPIVSSEIKFIESSESIPILFDDGDDDESSEDDSISDCIGSIKSIQTFGGDKDNGSTSDKDEDEDSVAGLGSEVEDYENEDEADVILDEEQPVVEGQHGMFDKFFGLTAPDSAPEDDADKNNAANAAGQPKERRKSRKSEIRKSVQQRPEKLGQPGGILSFYNAAAETVEERPHRPKKEKKRKSAKLQKPEAMDPIGGLKRWNSAVETVETIQNVAAEPAAAAAEAVAQSAAAAQEAAAASAAYVQQQVEQQMIEQGNAAEKAKIEEEARKAEEARKTEKHRKTAEHAQLAEADDAKRAEEKAVENAKNAEESEAKLGANAEQEANANLDTNANQGGNCIDGGTAAFARKSAAKLGYKMDYYNLPGKRESVREELQKTMYMPDAEKGVTSRDLVNPNNSVDPTNPKKRGSQSSGNGRAGDNQTSATGKRGFTFEEIFYFDPHSGEYVTEKQKREPFATRPFLDFKGISDEVKQSILQAVSSPTKSKANLVTKRQLLASPLGKQLEVESNTTKKQLGASALNALKITRQKNRREMNSSPRGMMVNQGESPERISSSETPDPTLLKMVKRDSATGSATRATKVQTVRTESPARTVPTTLIRGSRNMVVRKSMTGPGTTSGSLGNAATGSTSASPDKRESVQEAIGKAFSATPQEESTSYLQKIEQITKSADATSANMETTLTTTKNGTGSMSMSPTRNGSAGMKSGSFAGATKSEASSYALADGTRNSIAAVFSKSASTTREQIAEEIEAEIKEGRASRTSQKSSIVEKRVSAFKDIQASHEAK